MSTGDKKKDAAIEAHVDATFDAAEAAGCKVHPHARKLAVDVGHALGRAQNAGMGVAQAATSILGIAAGAMGASGCTRQDMIDAIDAALVGSTLARRAEEGGRPS